MSNATKAALEQLLGISAETAADASEIDFSRLKADPGRTSLKSILEELDKLNHIKQLCLPKPPWPNIPEKYVQKFAQRVAATPL